MKKRLSHYNKAGEVSMVDVSAKPATKRTAAAHAFVMLPPHVMHALPDNPKGDPLEVARIAGISAAKKTYELILTGEALGAEEALRLGFVNRVVPESELEKTVSAVLAKISEFSGPVLEVTKKVIGSSIGLPLDEAMKKSQNIYLNELMNLQDVQEGLRAVLEKRKPVWKNK